MQGMLYVQYIGVSYSGERYFVGKDASGTEEIRPTHLKLTELIELFPETPVLRGLPFQRPAQA